MDQKPNILIVDDESVGRQLLEAILFPEGYNLIFAEDGEMALQKAIETIPTVVLCDVMMPKMDGFEVCRSIRQNESIAHIPVFLITALDDRDSRIKGIDAGADDYISKPLDRIEILAKVRNRVILNKIRQKELNPDKNLSVSSTNLNENPLLTFLIQYFLLNPDLRDNTNIDEFRSKELNNSKYAFVDFLVPNGKFFAMVSNRMEGINSTLVNCILKLIIRKELDKNITSPSEIIQTTFEKFLHYASNIDLNRLLDTSYSIILIFQDHSNAEIIVSGLNQTLFASQTKSSDKPENNELFQPYYLMANQDIKLNSTKEIVLLSENIHELFAQPNLVSFLNTNLENKKLQPLSKIMPQKFDQSIDILAVKLSF